MRLTKANCGNAADQTFAFNPFGNINMAGSPDSFNASYNETTNRISLVGTSFTPTYDNNGNVLNDGVNTYTWDADGNSITVDAVGATFDALDRMVEQNRSSVYTEIVYSATGGKLALMTGQTLKNAFVNLPGKATAVYTSSGLDHYRHSDWLGSARLTSSPSQTVLSTTAYAPFGETYAPSGTADPSFTGQNSDTVSGDYDFLVREYSTQGRWPSPDPAGQAAANPMNPQSWNRYAYVLNNPLGFTDPLGLTCQWDDGTADLTGESEEGDNQNACESEGGTWVPPAPQPPWIYDASIPSQEGPPTFLPGFSPMVFVFKDQYGIFEWQGSSPPTGLANVATNVGTQPGQELAGIPSWYQAEVSGGAVGTPFINGGTGPLAISISGPVGGPGGLQSSLPFLYLFSVSAVNMPFPNLNLGNQSSGSCATAGQAITQFIAQHPGQPIPPSLTQAMGPACSGL